ncbi:TPA: hypothetical protein JA361_00040 [Legionella pneumophila]|nr:hypothetical protein [Legionella pneumophila]HAT8181526.1 hypothetical protein [Legionella pneumophila]
MNREQIDDIGILKSIWKKSDAGVWMVHDIQGIDLKPQEGFKKDYFKIKNEGNMMTPKPGPIMENFFATFGTTEFLVRQSIVPVIAWNDGDEEAQCIGTGFFISASGILMTAAHVLRDPVDEKYTKMTQVGEKTFTFDESLHYGVLIPANPAMKNAPHPPFKIDATIRSAQWFMYPFEWALHWGREIESPLLHERSKFELNFDIAICKVIENIGRPYQPLNIGLHNLKVGDRAVAIGYAEMRNIQFNNGEDYQPELIVSVGSVTNIHTDNITEKHNSTPGPNFEFDAKIPGKMSGSPILVGGGVLTKGVVSRSWQDDNYASGCLIAPMMNLPLINKKSLHEMMRAGEEGIVQILGPDL